MNNKKIINIAQEVINTEIAALKKLQKSIGKSFCQAINLILNTKVLYYTKLYNYTFYSYFNNSYKPLFLLFF